ncbi:MAG TPA: hypothetical protein VHV79_02095 [Mycobacteriales bacterium]|jgi:hypothetical protein|nr:hypothetical protein [Mycobacteriales bacterium]
MPVRGLARLLTAVSVTGAALAVAPATAAFAADTPAPPIITVTSPADLTLKVVATEPDGQPLDHFTATVTPTSGGQAQTATFSPGAGQQDSGQLEFPTLAPVKTAVVVTATRVVGGVTDTSADSNPVMITPTSTPRPPTSLQTGYARRVGTVRWQPPRDDGGEPILRYQAQLDCGSQHHHQTIAATARSARFASVRSNQACGVEVEALNKWGASSPALGGLETDVGLLTWLSSNGHTRWRYVAGGRAHALGGPAFGWAPSVSVDTAGHFYLLGATRSGTLYLHTSKHGWTRLDSPACLAPAVAIIPGGIFAVGCRSAAGTFSYDDSSPVSGGNNPEINSGYFVTTHRRILGRVSAAEVDLRASFFMRRPTSDAAGNNVSYFDSLSHHHWHPVRLHCTASPSVSGLFNDFSMTVGCRSGPDSVSWKLLDGDLNHHTRTSAAPFPITNTVSVASFDGGFSRQLAVRGTDGKVQVLDLSQRSWTLVPAVPSRSIYLFPYSSSREHNHTIVETA